MHCCYPRKPVTLSPNQRRNALQSQKRVVHLVLHKLQQLLIGHSPQLRVPIDVELLRCADDSDSDGHRDLADLFEAVESAQQGERGRNRTYALDVGVEEVALALLDGEGVGEGLSRGVDEVFGDL